MVGWAAAGAGWGQGTGTSSHGGRRCRQEAAELGAYADLKAHFGLPEAVRLF